MMPNAANGSTVEKPIATREWGRSTLVSSPRLSVPMPQGASPAASSRREQSQPHAQVSGEVVRHF
jgi:hypothetical protein